MRQRGAGTCSSDLASTASRRSGPRSRRRARARRGGAARAARAPSRRRGSRSRGPASAASARLAVASMFAARGEAPHSERRAARASRARGRRRSRRSASREPDRATRPRASRRARRGRRPAGRRSPRGSGIVGAVAVAAHHRRAPRRATGSRSTTLNRKRSSCASGSGYVPSCSIGFCVATTMKPSPSVVRRAVDRDRALLHRLEQRRLRLRRRAVDLVGEQELA